MISAPRPCSSCRRWTPSATVRSASMSSPESVSSRIAMSGWSIAICRISARFFSPPEKPSLRWRDVNERSTSSSSIACCSCVRNSLTWIGSSRLALIAMRRKLATETPGIDTGYWNARNRPAFARSCGSASVRSSPLKVIVPSVISYEGWPSSVLASVDLPEPFGPIRAWISPRLMSRSTPLRISRSSVRTCRSLISRSAMFSLSASVRAGFDLQARAGLLRERRGDEQVGERGLAQGADDRHPHARPQQLRGAHVVALGLAGADDRAVRRLRDALDRRDRALQRLDDLRHRDLRRRAREHVAAARAAPRVDQPGLTQARDEVLEVGERQPVAGCDLGQRDRSGAEPVGVVAAPAGQLHHHANAVLGLCREHHQLFPTCGLG